MQANNIQEVMAFLDQVIADCKQKKSRLGYFAVLYKLMTEAVANGISTGFFADGPRMERLDVVFANRYLQAYSDYSAGRKTTDSWDCAFKAAAKNDLVVVQHLLLGINAHINLDLGIAAADISTRSNINDLQPDFYKINDRISDVYGFLQEKFKKISWPAIFLEKINPRVTSSVINFSIGKARDLAWSNAILLCNAGISHRDNIIRQTDEVVCEVAAAIENPSFLKRTLLKIILFFEEKDVGENIGILSKK